MRLDSLLESSLVTEEETFSPPKDVQNAAKRGLELRKKNNGQGGTAVGVARARDLANGKNVSKSTIKRMKSYFARHRVDKDAKGWKASDSNYPSKGKVAWLCLSGDSNVLLSGGSTVTIKEIVESDQEFTVVSYNETTCEYEDKPVTGKHVRESSYKDFVRLYFNSWLRTGYSNRAYITCTPDHPVLNNGEWIDAGDMKNKTATSVLDFYDDVEEQVLRGSLLGDGCISNGRYQEAHGASQSEYLFEKTRLLTNIDPMNYSQIWKSGYGSGLLSHALKSKTKKTLRNLEEEYYKNSEKTITLETLQKLNDIGLAFWFMDDGSLHRVKDSKNNFYYRLHTEGFDRESIENIVEWFSGFGITARKISRENTNGIVLYFSPIDSKKISLRIAPFVYASMRYKLFPHHRQMAYSLSDYTPIKKYSSNDVLIKECRKVEDIHYSKQYRSKLTKKYDITVADNHNFVANGIVVHNCWGGDAGDRWVSGLNLNESDDSDTINEETVTWKWGDSKASGKVIKRYKESVTKTIKGTKVTKNGTNDNPAVHIEQEDGTEVLKLQSELS